MINYLKLSSDLCVRFLLVSASLVVLILAFLGFDIQDSAYAIALGKFDISFEFPLSTVVLRYLNYIGFHSVQQYYFAAFLYWFLTFLIYRKIGKGPVATFLFIISLFWFTGIFGYDALVLMPIATLVYLVKRKRLLLVLMVAVITVLFKVTSLAMVVPLVYYYVRKKTYRIWITFFGFSFAIIMYVSFERFSNHVTSSVLIEQYLYQLALLVSAFVIGHVLFFYKDLVRIPLRILLLVSIIVLGKMLIWNHREFAVIIAGLMLSLTISSSFKKFYLTNWNLLIVGLFLTSFIGSDTGIYKSVYVLPLFAMIETEYGLQKRLGAYFASLAFLCILLKPLYFNYGDRGTANTLLKNGLSGQNILTGLNIWDDPNHGTFVIPEVQAKEIRCVDSLYTLYEKNSPVILGPSSSYYKMRYGIEFAKPSFRGLELVGTSDVMIWIHQEIVDDSAYNHIKIQPDIILSMKVQKK